MILSDLYRLVLHWRHNRSTFRKGRNEMEKNSTSDSTYCCVEEYFKFPDKMVNKRTFWRGCKVEKTLKGSLDLIPSPSPSAKIQIMARRVCLRCKSKTLLGVVNKLLKTNPAMFYLLANNLNYHWRWRWLDQFQATYSNTF